MSSHQNLEPTVLIGKGGITENIIRKIAEQLKRNKVVKIKFLPSAIKTDKKALARQLAEGTSSKIEHRVGFVVVLSKGLKKGKISKR